MNFSPRWSAFGHSDLYDEPFCRPGPGLCPPEKVTNEMMVQALREEAQIKKTQEGKITIGFMRRNS